jgi:hypothetical protein
MGNVNGRAMEPDRVRYPITDARDSESLGRKALGNDHE